MVAPALLGGITGAAGILSGLIGAGTKSASEKEAEELLRRRAQGSTQTVNPLLDEQKRNNLAALQSARGTNPAEGLQAALRANEASARAIAPAQAQSAAQAQTQLLSQSRLNTKREAALPLGLGKAAGLAGSILGLGSGPEEGEKKQPAAPAAPAAKGPADLLGGLLGGRQVPAAVPAQAADPKKKKNPLTGLIEDAAPGNLDILSLLTGL